MKTLHHLLFGLGTAAALTAHAAAFPLTGKVLDAEGRPVAGAVIERHEYSRLPSASGEMEMRQRTTTDANGAFELGATRTYTVLLARKPGLAPAWKQFTPGPGAEQRLILTAPTVLAGVVVDEADQPVAGAQVSVAMAYSETTEEGGGRQFQYLSGQLARDSFTARTSADGRFRIVDFPTNATAELTVLAPGKARKPLDLPQYYSPDTMPFRAGQEDIRLVVEPAGSIEGRIIAEPGGPPLPKARLRLHADGPGVFGMMQRGPVESEADDSFRIADVPAGSYRLDATFGTNAVPDWVAEGVPVSVELGQVTRGVEIPATRGSLLAVTVLDRADRKPRAEVDVNAYREAFSAAAQSGSDGVAWLRLPPGAFRVAAHAEGWQSEDTAATMEAGQTNRVEIELTPSPKITGVVRRPDGQPAAGLPVQIVGVFSSDASGIKTDTNGQLEVEWDPRRYGGMERTYCLLIRDAEHDLAVAEDVDEETGPLNLRLAPGLTLAGKAECDGKPLTNVSVALVFWTGNSGMHLKGLNIATNTPGRFEIPALPPGRKYGVIVSAPGYGQKSLHNLEISADAGRQELDPVELKPANLQLAGQVLDADDKPVAGAHVQIYGDDQPTGSARTDREGRFRFAQVCEGPARLHANARNAYGNVMTEGGETNVILRLGESYSGQSDTKQRRLKGVVTDPDGRPVAGARLSVFPKDSNQWSKTGTNGAFDFKWSVPSWMQQQGGEANLVVLDAAKNLARMTEVAEEATNLDVQLKPALTLVGRVEGPGDQALTNAELGLWLQTGNMSSSLSEEVTRADATGHFEIKTLPPGARYTVWARAKGYGRSQQNVEDESGTNRFELEPFVLKVADQVLAGQVLNEKDMPLSGVHVNLSGENQPDESATTDREGRFRFKVCEGTVQLFANSQSGGYANTSAEAGDTNVILQIGRSEPYARPAQRVSSLKGKPLPDLTTMGLAADAAPSGKPILLCLLDVEQRPSRRMARLLAEQHDALREKGVTVLAVQAVITGAEALKEWQAASPVPFPVGRVSEKSPSVKWATDQESLPWLILTDAAGRVVAEGFPLEELEAKLTGK
jgi:protocatechuate 3,4-dioxygenase beta subunit